MYAWEVPLSDDTEVKKDIKNGSPLNPNTDLTWEVLSKAIKNLTQYNIHLCKDCKYLNGKSYSGNYLICGSHPYGCQNNNCADWEDKNSSI